MPGIEAGLQESYCYTALDATLSWMWKNITQGPVGFSPGPVVPFTQDVCTEGRTVPYC